MALSTAPLHFLYPDDQSEVQNNFLVMYYGASHYHFMPMASLHPLDQHDRNEVQHDFFLSCHATGTGVGIKMLPAFSMSPLHSLGEDNQN